MLRSPSRHWSVAFLGALLAFGWAGVAPAQAPKPPAATPAAAAGIGATAKNYVIGPGDVLDIFVWQNPDLSQKSVPVRPDGRISTPLIANIVAAGKTPVELAQDMDKALSAYIRSPRVTVIVSRAVGVLSQIQVIGQVARPESIAYHEGMTVLDAVLAAGGLTPYAAGNRAKLERKVDGRVETLHLKLSNLINKGDLSQNLALQPGDVLVVPESMF
jgi:polysaccharide export outer membrane protein